MERLVLYVDSKYAIGAYCTDGVCRPIRMMGGEERAWFYFHEDTEHNEISFSKQYESHTLNRESHYYGDVFDHVCDFRYMFTQYEHNSELRNIFKASGLFDQFKQPFENKKSIETYITFAGEVRNAARAVFIEELKESDFDVRLSVVPCGQLVLEYMIRKRQQTLDGGTLVLSALNDNLWYSVYEQDENGLHREVEKTLPGMGMDLRERALVEEVLQKVNRNHFLKDDEVEYERQRLHRIYIDKWMSRLDEARPDVAVAIDNFRLSIASNILYTNILSKDIENRTLAIVDEIVHEIWKDTSNRCIKRVLLLGDTFSNQSFISEIKRRLDLPDERILHIPVHCLTEILGVYPELDVDLFSVAESQFRLNAEEEQNSIETAIRDEIKQIQVVEARRQQIEADRVRRNNEVWYSTEMQNVHDYEERREYAKMLNACMEALKRKPGDEEAEKKRNDAIRYMAQEEIESRMYADAITRAKDSVVKKQYSEALTLSEMALSIRPSSDEALKIKKESLTNIENESRIKDLIISATVYYGQNVFSEAEKELNKILKLDSQNEQALVLKEKIEKRKADIEDLTKQFDEAEQCEDVERMDFLCSEVKSFDLRLAEKWSSHIDDLRKRLEQKRRDEELLVGLKKEIDSAMLNENWEQVVSLCKESLGIKKSEEIQTILSQVQERIELSSVREKFLLAFSKKEWREAYGIIKVNPNLKKIADIKEKYDIVKKNMKPKPPISQPQQIEESDITISPNTISSSDKKFKRPIRQTSTPLSKDNRHTSELPQQKQSVKTKYPKVKRNK